MKYKVLQQAAVSGNLKAIKRLLLSERESAGKDIVPDNGRWKAAFFRACENNHHDIVSFLLRYGMKAGTCDGNLKTALMYACEKGSDKVVRLLLKTNIYIDDCDRNGLTALMLSCQNGHLTTVKLLLKKLLHLDARDEKGRTALMIACEQKHKEIAFCLMNRDANVDACDRQGGTALMYACRSGCTDCALFLILYDACTDSKDNVGNTALIYAGQGGHLEVVRVLMQEGSVDPNIQVEGGKTALIHAVELDDKKVAQQLLDYANPTVCDSTGTTALMYACMNNSVKIVNLIMEYGVYREDYYTDTFWYDALVYCCIKGYCRIVKLFIQHECNLDYFHDQEHPKQPLMYACESGQSSVVTVLLSNGVNLDDYHNYGNVVYINTFDGKFRRTALMYACVNGHVNVVRILTKFKVNASAKDVYGQTALMHACESGHTGVVKCLMELTAKSDGFNVDIDAQDTLRRRTALMYACSKGFQEIVSLLIEYGADVNKQDFRGESALMLACSGGFDKVVSVLLSKSNVDVNFSSALGKTSFVCACSGGHENVVRLLMNFHGGSVEVDMNAVGEIGHSGLMHACVKGHEKVVDLLIRHKGVIDIDSAKSAFLFACTEGWVDIVTLMLNHYKLDINVLAKAVDIATWSNHDRIVCILLRHGAVVNNPGILLPACKSGNEEIVALLVKSEDMYLNVRDGDGKTGLIHASANGFHTIVSLLLNVGEGMIDIDACDCSCKTALMYACEEGHEDIAEILINNGAIVGVFDKDDVKALTYAACEIKNKNIVSLVIRKMFAFHFPEVGGELSLSFASGRKDDDGKKGVVSDDGDHLSICGDENQNTSPLICACQARNRELVGILLKHFDVDCCDSNRKSALMYACEKGYKDIVDLLVENGAELNSQDVEGRTALMYAWEKKHDDIVCQLLRPGDDVDSLRYFGDKGGEDIPLMYACGKGNEEMVKRLIELGADVNARGFGKTALIQACGARGDCVNLSIVKMLATHPDIDINAQDSKGKTALAHACGSARFNGRKSDEIVSLLLDHSGIDVNIRDTDNKTALMDVFCLYRPQVVDLLIQQAPNIDLDAQDRDGKTALMYAIESGYKITTRLLIKHFKDVNARDSCECSKMTALMRACETGQLSFVKQLVNRDGIDLNVSDDEGWTAFMWACGNGYEDIVKLLISCNVDVNVKDCSGQTALMYACIKSHKKIVSLLLNSKTGVDINVRDKELKTCLIHLCSSRLQLKREVDIVEMLIKLGVDVAARDDDGRTALDYACHHNSCYQVLDVLTKAEATISPPIHHEVELVLEACSENHAETVDILLERIFNINVRDAYGKGLLICAVEGYNTNILGLEPDGPLKLVKILLKHDDLELNAQDEQGCTALMYACMKGREEIVELLLNYQVNVNICDQAGHTALMYSCEKWNANIVQLLLRHDADVNARNNDGRSAFSYCCSDWQFDILDWIKQPKGKFRNKNGSKQLISPDEQSEEDKTAIAEGLKIDFVYLLIKEGLSINAQVKHGETALMAVAKADFWSNFNGEIDRLLNLGADVDMTDRKGGTVFSYAMEGTGKAMKDLLNSGKLFCNGGETSNLKPIHRNAVTKATDVTFRALAVVLKKNIFEWEWCRPGFVVVIGLKALEMGLCPGCIQSDVGGILSPLIQACIDDNLSAVKAFMAALFFFPEDYIALRTNKALRGRITNPSALDEVISTRPLTLESWSVLTVSKAISLTGHPTQRAQRVDTLPIPELLKRKLKFQDFDRQLFSAALSLEIVKCSGGFND